MGIKKEFLFILCFFLCSYMFADGVQWCDSMLQKQYSDRQLTYWTSIISQAKLGNNKKQISESEYMYSYKEYLIYEDISNLSGKANVDSEATISFKIPISSEVTVMLHLLKGGTIIMQVVNINQKLFYMRYTKDKYSYSYYKDGVAMYSYDILERK